MPKGPTEDVPEVLTVEQAAERLGVTETWLRDRVKAKRIAHTRLGRYIRFTAADLAAILEASRVEAQEEAKKGPVPTKAARSK